MGDGRKKPKDLIMRIKPSRHKMKMTVSAS